ncbi:MAG TPA: hypothetical protein VGE08_12660 [Steroidobacter sp.]|uniref:hypothetical protein n=1 Tax=Steroidobacter sp. TaxID=1978227 RepID=UPI002ED98E4B
MRLASFGAVCLIGAMTCALSGCAGDGTGLDTNGRPLDGNGGDGSDTLQPTFQSIQEQVFTPICTACHAGAAAPLGLRLEAGASYALLVNASSVEVPALMRVQPGNPDASYLIQKLEGTAAVGGRMPLNGTPLPQATIDVIRQWITDGATDGTAGVSSDSLSEVAKLTAVLPISGKAMSQSTRDIVVTSSVELDTSLLQAGLVTLRASGGDGEFDSGNEILVPVEVTVRSQLPTVLAITPRSMLAADTYELRIAGDGPVALADFQARAIDGDGNSTPGGDFVLRFTVETTR